MLKNFNIGRVEKYYCVGMGCDIAGLLWNFSKIQLTSTFQNYYPYHPERYADARVFSKILKILKIKAITPIPIPSAIWRYVSGCSTFKWGASYVYYNIHGLRLYPYCGWEMQGGGVNVYRMYEKKKTERIKQLWRWMKRKEMWHRFLYILILSHRQFYPFAPTPTQLFKNTFYCI